MNFLVYSDDGDTELYLKSQLLLIYELMILVWGSAVLAQKGFGACGTLFAASLPYASIHRRLNVHLPQARADNACTHLYVVAVVRNASEFPREGARSSNRGWSLIVPPLRRSRCWRSILTLELRSFSS